MMIIIIIIIIVIIIVIIVIVIIINLGIGSTDTILETCIDLMWMERGQGVDWIVVENTSMICMRTSGVD